MSRVPIHLQPWPTDTSVAKYQVLSEEWSSEPSAPADMGEIEVAPGGMACTFRPSALWLSTGYFPQGEATFTLSEVEALCSESEAYAPRSIYSHRTLQAIRSILKG